ncbi:BgTH12-02154 [Blumeria graminis f. sp. triticale]|uniref:BgTH12-02154 n=1 Tax=Blumeria graminis f. sp. triticale TaxID=1689686 RepID=A0A9W4GDU4_BLUGR|nr:BgTH12-02154 [Blumeria graminis f. sp. triticale]
MKFFSPAITATLAGLLQLVTASTKFPYFVCDNGQLFKNSLVQEKALLATQEISDRIYPPVPKRECRKSFAFQLEDEEQVSHRYLVQESEQSPTYLLFQLVGRTWNPCTRYRQLQEPE